MNKFQTYLYDKELKFIYPFLLYLIGLACFLVTLIPFFDSLIPESIPQEIINQIGNMNLVVYISSLSVLTFSFFFESYIFFLVATFLGAQLKYKKYLSIFAIANIPMGIKFLAISLKNVIITNPSPYLIFKTKNFLGTYFDLFNIFYLIILFLLLKNNSSLNKFSLSVFIIIAFLYRVIF